MAAAFQADLPCAEKFVLVALADRASDDGSDAYPSIRRLSRMCGLSGRQVQRVLARLVKRGLIEVDVEATEKRPTNYCLKLDGLDPAPEPSSEKTCPRALRRKVISAFENRCVHCGGEGEGNNGPDGKPWHVDRIIPGSRGGGYTPENITLSCNSCNTHRKRKTIVSAPSYQDRLRGPVQAQLPQSGVSISTRMGCQTGPTGVSNKVHQGCQTGPIEGSTKEPSFKPQQRTRASRVVAPEFLTELWNEYACGKVKPVGEMTPTRRRLVQRAWMQHPDPTWWRDAMTRAYQSRFLRGAKGWAMTFNWFMSKDNAVQVVEGVHDNKPGDFPKAEERAREVIRATGGYCRHVPTCADREAHVDRVVDSILAVDVEKDSS